MPAILPVSWRADPSGLLPSEPQRSGGPSIVRRWARRRVRRSTGYAVPLFAVAVDVALCPGGLRRGAH